MDPSLRPRALFVALLLGAHALLPLRYYLGVVDGYDERFAWRMFSPERMVRCGARFTVDGAAIDLEEHFHAAWITLVGRGRLEVTEAVGARVCLMNPGREVRLHYVCEELGGERRELAAPTRDICPEGRW